MSSHLERIVVVGSRRFEDRQFLRHAMLQAFQTVQSQQFNKHPDFIQFVVASEFGRDGVERPCPGVASLVVDILRDARRSKRGDAETRVLMPALHRVDWENKSPFSTAPSRWVTSVFEDVYWEGARADSADSSWGRAPQFVVAVHGAKFDGLASMAVKAGRGVNAHVMEFATGGVR